MDIESLLVARTVLKEVMDDLSRLSEEKDAAMQVRLHCQIVILCLDELALHLEKGLEPYDALLTMARGDTDLTDLGIPESQLTAFSLCIAALKEALKKEQGSA